MSVFSTLIHQNIISGDREWPKHKAYHLFPLLNFNEDPTTAGTRWTKWVKRFELLMTGMGINDNERKKALLLHYIGEETYDIYDSLPQGAPAVDPNAADQPTVYEIAKQKMTDYFAPKVNVDYEIHKFRQIVQEENEPIDAFHTRLRQAAIYCDFQDIDREIKLQVIHACHSRRLRRKGLKTTGITLTQILDEGRALELAENQAKTMESTTKCTSTGSNVNVNLIHPRKTNFSFNKRYNNTRNQKQKQNPQHRQQRLCWYCRGTYPHKPQGTPCPAQGAICRKCGKQNHYARCCRSTDKKKFQSSQQHVQKNRAVNKQRPRKDINYVKQTSTYNDESSTDDDYAFTVHTGLKQKQPNIMLKVAGIKLNVLVDSGASTNILSEEAYRKLGDRVKLTKAKTNIFSYNATEPLKLIGQFTCEVQKQSSEDKVIADFCVVKGQGSCLIGFHTAVKLGILQIINMVECNKEQSGNTDIVEQFPECFSGLGKLKNFKLKIHINPDVTPVAQPPRKVPFGLREAVTKQLDELLQKDVIEKVEGLTEWVSPLVVIPKKNGEVRICVDMRQANQAVVRERHPLPTADDIFVEFSGAQVFSKLDLNSTKLN